MGYIIKDPKFKWNIQPKISINQNKWSETDLELLINWSKGYVKQEEKPISWLCNRLGRTEDAIDHKIRDLKKEGKL